MLCFSLVKDRNETKQSQYAWNHGSPDAKGQYAGYEAWFINAYDAHWNVQDTFLCLSCLNYSSPTSLQNYSDLVPLYHNFTISSLHFANFSRNNLCLWRLAFPNRPNQRVKKTTTWNDDFNSNCNISCFLFFRRDSFCSSRE